MRKNEGACQVVPDVNATVPRTDFRRPVYCVLGLPLDAINMQEAVASVAAAVAERTPYTVSTPNLNMLVAALTDLTFRDAVLRSNLTLADGMPLIWIARLLGLPVRTRVAGSDLFEALTRGEGGPMKVYFFGGPEGAAEKACQRLNALNGALRCTGSASPGFGSVEQLSQPAMLEHINQSNADFVVIAMGTQKGAAWIEHNRAKLYAPVFSHLGAVVNFVAGGVMRAPLSMQKMGLEWLWRIKEEPQLWRRYWKDGSVFLRLMATRVLPCMLYRKYVRRSTAPSITSDRTGNATYLTLKGSWKEGNLSTLCEMFERITLQKTDIEFDMSGVDHLDEAAIGLLLLLYGHQSKVDCAFRLHRPSSRVRMMLKLCCADYLMS